MNSDEKGWVEGILKGDKGVFACFYRQQVRGLRRFILSKVGNSEDAEELVQDIFLAFLDSLPVFSFRSSLKTFLYSIARHEVADYYRRRYAKRALKLVPLLGEYVSEPLYTTSELSRRIDRVYQKIVPDYRRILQLKYEDGLSVKDLAKKLKLSVKAVESKLFRARRAFQLAYEEG